MDPQTLLTLASIIIGFSLLIYIVKSELSKITKTDENKALLQWLKSMQVTIDATNKTLHDTMRGTTSDMTKALQENSKQLNDRLDTAARVIGDLKRNLGEMSEVWKGIRSLQEFLQSPKLRGGIGEEVLKEMIGQTFQTFPPDFCERRKLLWLHYLTGR